MIRALGSVLVAAGAAWAGFSAAGRYRTRVRRVEELAGALALMEQELTLSEPDLETLVEELARRSTGGGRALFSSFRRGLAHMERQPVAEIWERSVLELDDLPAQGRDCLLSLGQVLGRYDAREQCARTAAVRRCLERLAGDLRAQCQTSCRLSQTVALSGGAFLVILLL